MGPKRKQGNDEAQQTLLGFFQSPSHSSTPSTSENDLSPSKSTHSAFSYEESNSETRPKAKKSRKYNKDWEKLFSWVAFDEESKSMYCTLCTDAKKVNGMVKSVQCTNFQQSTLSRHASLPEHKMLVEANGEQQEKTSQPLIDPVKTIEKWQLVKQVVIAEQYPRDSMHQLWSLIVKYHPEFPNLNILAKLALTSSVHTAGCERGFSVQNRILTTFRNRLNIDTQHCLMMLKLDSHSRLTFNFDLALLKWKKTKDRRLYELKYKQK